MGFVRPSTKERSMAWRPIQCVLICWTATHGKCSPIRLRHRRGEGAWLMLSDQSRRVHASLRIRPDQYKVVHDQLMWAITGRQVGPATLTAPMLTVLNPHSRVIPLLSLRPSRQAAAAGGAPKRLMPYRGDIGVAVQHVGVLVGAPRPPGTLADPAGPDGPAAGGALTP